MEIITTTALALATVVATKALETTGEKIGEALWDKSKKFLESLKKHSSDTVLAIEEASQKPLDYGQAIIEIESAAQSDDDIAQSLEELASIAKDRSVPELNEKLNEIFAEIQKSVAKSPQSFPTHFNQHFQKAVNVGQNQKIDQRGSTFNI